MIASKRFAGSNGFSYARFSDLSQGEGHSIERQEDYAPQFCDEYGLNLNHNLSFRDRGRSAFKGEHLRDGMGQLQRFLQCIESGVVKPGDFLIVENLDRLSRLELSSAEQLLHSILSRGVRIHTRSPWAIYDRKTLNNPMERMQMIFEFTRSHRESRMKQERLSRRWESNRKNIKAGEYFIGTPPSWLKVNRVKGHAVGYEAIPERVAIVRKVFELSISGLGLNAVCRALNKSETPTLGKASHWGRSTIAKLLGNRAVLGEYQPFTAVRFDEEGKQYESTEKRVHAGDPIPDHFPRIIDDKTFEQAQLAISKRRIYQAGRGTESEKIVNLFAGLLRDARDGSPMHVIDKGDGPRVISIRGYHHAKGSTYLPVPYIAIEQAFVTYVDQMPLSAVMPSNKQSKGVDAEIAKAQKEIESLELQVSMIKEKTRKKASDVLLELLVERDSELRAKRHELEALEQKRGSTQEIAARSTKDQLRYLSGLNGKELFELRKKLRNEIRFWIKQIAILPIDLSGVRAALVDVELQDGRHLEFRASADKVDYPPEFDKLKVREYAKWPAELQKTHWEIESALDAEIKDLASKGFNGSEIAAETGESRSVISRHMIKLGLRARPRKSADSAELMSWHEAGKGWAKTSKGKRHYIGMGALKKLYPKLIKSLDRAGTAAAANRWWTEHGSKG